MTTRCWRIVKQRFATVAFDGEGARLHGGRWNSPGVAMVYTAGSPSLAALEVLVNLNSGAQLAASYVTCVAHFDDSLMQILEPASLPRGWRGSPAPARLRSFGDGWIAAGASPVLRVPSVLIEREHNFLLNPHHPDFASVVVGDPRPFGWDSRLQKLYPSH